MLHSYVLSIWVTDFIHFDSVGACIYYWLPNLRLESGTASTDAKYLFLHKKRKRRSKRTPATTAGTIMAMRMAEDEEEEASISWQE